MDDSVVPRARVTEIFGPGIGGGGGGVRMVIVARRCREGTLFFQFLDYDSDIYIYIYILVFV